MRYILINDIFSFFKKYYKFVIFYYFILLIYIGINALQGVVIDNDLIMKSIGMIYSKSASIMDIIIFIFNFGFNIFIVFQLFDNDIRNGMCNIFLRIKLKKWIYLKLFSMFVINFIKNLLIYILFVFYYMLKGFDIIIFIKYLMISMLFVFLIDLIFFAIFIFTDKLKYFIIFMLVVFILDEVVPINIYLVEEWFEIYVISVLCVLLLLKVKKIRKEKILEWY